MPNIDFLLESNKKVADIYYFAQLRSSKGGGWLVATQLFNGHFCNDFCETCTSYASFNSLPPYPPPRAGGGIWEKNCPRGWGFVRNKLPHP